jgi:hypothetical protein
MEKTTDRWTWIRDLVRAEQAMEETGVVDMQIGFDNEHTLKKESVYFLQSLKNDFVDAANTFNELKTSPLGRVKIYGIAKTEADFMLFRNGFKMVFSLKAPGQLSIRFNFIGPASYGDALPSVSGGMGPLMEEHLVEARKGPFNEVGWTFRDQPIKKESLVRFYLSMFLRESAK